MASKKESSKSEAPSSTERTRSSGSAPRLHELTARRGRVRDALAALGNVEVVLRSPHAAPIEDEVEELRRGLAWLREAFEATTLESADDQRDARRALEAFAAERVRAIESALVNPKAAGVAELLSRAGADLDAAAGLLDLAERATEGVPVEVSVATLAEQALRLAWTIRAHGAVGIHVLQAAGDCSVSCDPHVVARVLAIAVSAVREASPAVVVRTHVEDDAGVIEVTGYTPDDLGAAVMQTRLVRRIAPTDAVLAAAARAAGIGLVVEPGRVLLRCPRVA